MNTRPEQASKDTSGLTLQVALQRQDFRLDMNLELAGGGITALFFSPVYFFTG